MTKKILWVILTIVFIGVPSFAMAGCSVPGVDTQLACETVYGTWTADSGLTGVSGGNTGLTGVSNAVQVSTQLQNPIKFDSFSQLAAQVTKTAVEILLPFVVLAFIWSGFLFVRAQGNETELKEAKSAIKWSIIGAFILMGAWGFATMISQTVQTLTN